MHCDKALNRNVCPSVAQDLLRLKNYYKTILWVLSLQQENSVEGAQASERPVPESNFPGVLELDCLHGELVHSHGELMTHIAVFSRALSFLYSDPSLLTWHPYLYVLLTPTHKVTNLQLF